MLGEQLKAAGQVKAVKRSGNEWVDTALAKLKEFCTNEYVYGDCIDITIDDFRQYGGCPEPAHPNAWGALPKAAVKAGYIKPTSRTEKALRPKAQSRIVKVWDINPAAL